mmetsp:Transcript_24290/g.62699  ORF Transcript_24290/g.62699 Transcript_24290/m.62699 type:complete len:211 (-) Transcript_24290:2534-3166(-)
MVAWLPAVHQVSHPSLSCACCPANRFGTPSFVAGFDACMVLGAIHKAHAPPRSTSTGSTWAVAALLLCLGAGGQAVCPVCLLRVGLGNDHLPSNCHDVGGMRENVHVALHCLQLFGQCVDHLEHGVCIRAAAPQWQATAHLGHRGVAGCRLGLLLATLIGLLLICLREYHLKGLIIAGQLGHLRAQVHQIVEHVAHLLGQPADLFARGHA